MKRAYGGASNMRGDSAQSIVSIGCQGVYSVRRGCTVAHPHSSHINFLVLTLVELETSFAEFSMYIASTVDDLCKDVGRAQNTLRARYGSRPPSSFRSRLEDCKAYPNRRHASTSRHHRDSRHICRLAEMNPLQQVRKSACWSRCSK